MLHLVPELPDFTAGGNTVQKKDVISSEGNFYTKIKNEECIPCLDSQNEEDKKEAGDVQRDKNEPFDQTDSTANDIIKKGVLNTEDIFMVSSYPRIDISRTKSTNTLTLTKSTVSSVMHHWLGFENIFSSILYSLCKVDGEKLRLLRDMEYTLPFLILINCCSLQGVLEWTVIRKVTDYGQNVTLFCNVSNCCPQASGWDRYSSEQRTLFIDLKTGRPNRKYDGKVTGDGYTLIIQNLTKSDLNVSYACVYGVTIGEIKYLLEEDVFTYINSTQQNVSNGKSKFSDGEIAAVIAGFVVLMSALFFIYVWRRRRRRKRRQRYSGISYDTLNVNGIGKCN
ncbi:unnamed protein product [Mytilus edulis]|uniref:Uncharacterized protein n=1 Tax=Mytilus edulis TaxID=6550 RepID=A0A8S3TKH1_MYTED|nr:unnamed protein product [Mytilus edulis]